MTDEGIIIKCIRCESDIGDKLKFKTPKGYLCKYCWCLEMGEMVEKHPIHIG